MQRKRITNISEIYDGTHLIIKDFTNLDLSNIDLSDISMREWEGCVFYNTNFHNTGIKFIPNKLKYVDNTRVIDMSYCDFSDNDLSFLTDDDICVDGTTRQVRTTGCDISNTGINCIRCLEDMTLDKSYADIPKEFWGEWGDYHRNGSYVTSVDIETLKKSPFLNLSSSCFYRILGCYAVKRTRECVVRYNNTSPNYIELDEVKVARVVDDLEKLLYLDKDGHFRRLYYQVAKNLTTEQKFWFLRHELIRCDFKDVDFADIPFDVFSQMYFEECRLDNVKIDYNINQLTSISPEHFLDYLKGHINSYSNVSMPKIKYGSWQDKLANERRISSSAFTFFTKVYLELSRDCNARCKFCRNSSFESSEYDLQQILETLERFKKFFNAVVIGGGEPTLRLDDIKYLKEKCDAEHIDWHMFTNGTKASIIDDNELMDNFKINLSRHAVSDEDNARIFGLDSSKIMSIRDIERLNARNNEVTLNATCISGGLDSASKISEYIAFARAIGCKKVLIQNLQQDSSLGIILNNKEDLRIADDVFDSVKDYLLDKNYRKKKYSIIASGGYETEIFRDGDFSVSLQKYISEDEMNRKWLTAIKRAFDLSIDPSGNLYENWHQRFGLVENESEIL